MIERKSALSEALEREREDSAGKWEKPVCELKTKKEKNIEKRKRETK